MAIQRYGAIEKSTVLDAEVVSVQPRKVQRPALQKPVNDSQKGIVYGMLGVGGTLAFFWITFLLSTGSALMQQPRIETNTTCWSCEVEVRK